MYTFYDFPTKKSLKQAVTEGKEVRIYQPGGLFTPPESSPSYTGKAYVEGPHYPKPHKWYAEVDVVNGKVVKVK